MALAAPDALRAQALQAAREAALSGPYPAQRVNWLAMLGPLTDGTQQRQLMAAAFSAATEIGDEMERGEALNNFLAFVLPADFLPAAMEAAEGIKFELARNPAVHALTRASQAASPGRP